MRQTLTDDFWGLHKNMNCVFPLSDINFCTYQFSSAIFCCTKDYSWLYKVGSTSLWKTQG